MMCSKIIIIEVLQILCTTILIIDNLYFSLQNPVLCYNIPPGIENHIHIKIVKVLANYMVNYNKKLLLFLSQDKSAGVLPSLNRQEWLSNPVRVQAAQSFRSNLMEHILQMRDDPNVLFTVPLSEKTSHRKKKLLHNIALVPRPEQSVLVAIRTSRFGGFLRATPY